MCLAGYHLVRPSGWEWISVAQDATQHLLSQAWHLALGRGALGCDHARAVQGMHVAVFGR